MEDWRDKLDQRQLVQVNHATEYAEQFASAGVPGHNHLLLIAKLVEILDEVTGQTNTMRNIKG
jgi:hypothetical protein